MSHCSEQKIICFGDGSMWQVLELQADLQLLIVLPFHIFFRPADAMK